MKSSKPAFEKNFYFQSYLMLLLIVASLFFNSSVYSQDIAASQVQINANNLSQGYIYLNIPIYGSDENDEGITPTDSRAGKIIINNHTVLRFWSFHGPGDGQGEDSWYWVKSQVSYPGVSVQINETYNGSWEWIVYQGPSFSTANYTRTDIDEDNDTEKTWAQVKVCLPADWLDDNLDVYVTYYVDEDGGGDAGQSTSSHFTSSGLSFPTPNLSQSFSSTAGKYNISTNISPTGQFSKYEYSIDGTNYNTLVAGSVVIPVDINETIKTETVRIKYTVGQCGRVVVRSNTITLPAYPQAKNFTVSQLSNGNTSIEWTANTTNLGSNPVSGDQFEIQRADNAEFNNAISIAKVNYDATKSSYSIVDVTSEQNLNGTYYYRIRRTKTQVEWGWDLCSTASVVLSMTHKNISGATATLLAGNITKITWEYNTGNVWSEGSNVIIERYNITNGGIKEIIVVPADSLVNKSYSEELFQMCNKFTYKIYVKPGSPKYTQADPFSIQNSIVPLESGKLLSLNASKGYFSNRTDLSWETDGMPIDYFMVKSRIYQSGNQFKQIDQVTGTDGSEYYQYSDKQANPGEIYEYQVTGVTKCADVTINTEALYTYGFRTPTGDIYGRVAFNDGQAEQNVEVRLESSDGISGQSLVFLPGQSAMINNTSFLKNNSGSVTIQAWVSPDEVTSKRVIFSKPGMYEVGITANNFYFTAGEETLVSRKSVISYTTSSSFVHVSSVCSGDSLYIFINGQCTDSLITNKAVVGNSNAATIGNDFVGAIDELRIWNRALSAKEIARDYNHYITGSETGLIAYWDFNYATTTEFYDRSYKNSDYNENHGQINGAVTSITRIPTNEQLGYKGITGLDGSYSIRAIPYSGNGTLYTIIPRLGIHQFEPQKELRFIGEGSESFTVNFTDKSSFKVTGTITYEGGTIPVEGVSFTIDGIVATGANGTVVMTDAAGEFELSVPVGSHEVIAQKANHQFKNDGKITDSYGVNLNFQDEVLGIKLTDITKVKYIGRVAGGALQDSYILGHSLSKNNLADGVTVTLTAKNPAYNISNTDRTENYKHFLPSNKNGEGWPKTNDAIFSQQTITVYPNSETGEFVVEVIPVKFTVRVNAPGHPAIPGSGQDLDLTQMLVKNHSIRKYVDSSLVDETWIKATYSDTAYYNAAQKFIKRYAPTVRIQQLDSRMKVSPYYGDTSYVIKTLGGDNIKVNLFPDSKYLFNLPVFTQGETYSFKSEVFEKYIYYSADGTVKPGIPANEVPTKDATVQFTNNLSKLGIAEVEADTCGIAKYDFIVQEPELTSALRAISAKIYYGNDDNRTSINWDGAFMGIILGSVQTGRDFITGGPDKVLMVLRDPPGSGSYSYLEKGVTVTESSTYNGSAQNTGSELFTKKLGTELITWTGVGAGTIQSAANSTGFTLGVVHEENVGGSESREKTTTTTTKFQTSSEEDYVGADADVFVGYSTNIAYGSTECVSIISRDKYLAKPVAYQVYENITPVTSPWLLVKQTGLGLAQTFGTLFAYPQSHIVDRLLPEMINLRNNFLMQPGESDISTLQNLANQLDTTFYLSHLSLNDPNYGKSNSDPVFKDAPDPDPENDYIGASYRVIYPQRADYTRNDTILYLNQSINNWYKQLSKNEEAKINAKLLQNYSFHGGSPVEYSESYSTTSSSTTSFDIMIGGNFKNETDVTIMGSGFKFEIDETVTTTHGGEFVDSDTEQHSKGFVLSESNSDYISVDVMREDADASIGNGDEKEDFYPTFVFKTKAGATACPYEDTYVTKFFEPGQHVINQATKKIEVPEIAVKQDFIENVPSGGSANFLLYLRNNSEIKQDNWFTLDIVDQSNPNGAKLFIDGSPIGNGLDFLVPAGQTLSKTLEITKGSELNYDNLKLVLHSQCQEDINDTIIISVHFIPSCSDVAIEKPGNSWTYNTKLPTVIVDGLDKHYLDILINGFDVNYTNFNHIKLQYKSSSQSDEGWSTLMNYFSDSALYLEALKKGNAEFINPANAGTIRYMLKIDDLPDQLYDLRAVSVCLINNEEVENFSETVSGIKDMYRPRLFGSPQPANGILTIQDDIRLNFNERIADGLLTKNNFQVKGIRNGAKTDHSVSISLDGINDYMETEFEKNMSDKDITVEMWIKTDQPVEAVLFNHGNINESIGMALTIDNHLKLWVGDNVVTSTDAVPFEAGSWAHVAFVYSKSGYITGFYNFSEIISGVHVGPYNGIGNIVLGKNISENSNYFKGFMHNVRIWNTECSSGQLQVKSLAKLSGNEPGLLAYYPMTAAKGNIVEDEARGANLLINGCIWSTPEGRAIILNGTDSYVKLNTGSSAVVDESMDYTIEFWFKGQPGQTNATLLSSGRGDGNDMGGSNDLFSIEFDANGKLCFRNNGFTSTLSGTYLDNNWHHFAINVGRTIGRGQIYIDGNLVNFFSSDELGGLASSFMYIGARGWYNEGNASTLIIDNYFKGVIDELRIWNLYKYEKQIQDFNNVKLDGTEMGLLAYYPFEYYKDWLGMKELDFTLADMKIQKDPANKVPDALAQNIQQDSDTPPVKDKGPVSDLEFDFVVNNDALIIYLEETPEKIEKTIVTFTVDGVQDVNGNENISPFTWSAFIDQNMLKWGETSLTVSKPLDKSLKFTVKAHNKGGAVETFYIQNMPSWMRVTPTRETINPNSSIDITFEIDEGLNVGTYNETVYLTNNNNVSEALEITVISKGANPEWIVKPGDYNYNMTIYAKLRINNIFSKDPEDKIAAFANGVCIGVANVQYEQRNDMWYAFLTAYSNQTTTKDLIFKIWDASTGIVYVANPGSSIDFINNSTIGTPAEPRIFDASNFIYQNIDLSPGWNWISFNVKSPVLSSLNHLLSNLEWDSQNFFKSEVDNISANFSTQQSRWIEEAPLTLSNKYMYKISSSKNQTISLSGARITPSAESMEIKGNRWNFISFIPATRMKLDEALAGYDATEQDIIKTQNGFAMYSGNIGWVGSLTYLQPNKGYMLYRNHSNSATLKYPDSPGSMTKMSWKTETESEYVNTDYSSNMSIVAKSNINPQVDDRILAYNNGILSSETSVSDDTYFITVPGDATGLISFTLERNGLVIGNSKEIVPFIPNMVKGTLDNPFILHFDKDDDRILAYPNPFRNEVTISLTTKKTGPVEIKIIDVAGRTMMIKQAISIDGQLAIIIDCSSLDIGLYFARVTIDDMTKVIKIEKQ